MALDEINQERIEKGMRPTAELSYITWERVRAEFIDRALAVNDPERIKASLAASRRAR